MRSSRTIYSTTIWLGWLGLFVALEGLALSGRVPWTTLSQFAWDAEVRPSVRWGLLVGLAVLQAHIVGRWPR
jgi:hypothetical protein